MCAAHAVLDVALPTVIDQRVTGVEARRTWFALVRRLGEPAPGPVALTVPPSAERIAALNDYERRRYGLELRRGATLVAVARHAARLQRAAGGGSEVLQRELRTLPGVGPWTSAIVAELVCGDPDAVAVGDWHLPRIVGWALAGEPRADDARMLDLLDPFRPQRGRVIRMLLAAGAGPARTAPRAEIPDLVGRDFRGERDYRIRRSLRFERP
jgi:3-methyladenine DNA glycosylase/8-oxoguanine DNA glycosylase